MQDKKLRLKRIELKQQQHENMKEEKSCKILPKLLTVIITHGRPHAYTHRLNTNVCKIKI